MQSSSLKIRWVSQISEIDREAWDALALPLKTPFLEWNWLWLMEASGSASARAGWIPQHLTVWSGNALLAAAPLYIKTHSAGEFVFDQAWAEVAGQLGLHYYPKLVGMSPFTPLIGYRFLMAPGADETQLTGLMIDEIERFCRRQGLSGASFLFADPQWAEFMQTRGYTPWVHSSFSWTNSGLRDFKDYLSEFSANQRRNIRRERLGLERQGVTVRMIPGDELPAQHYSRMYEFYARTNDKFGPWGCKYLTPDFFSALPGRFRHRLLFGVANGRDPREAPLGMSLCVTKGDQLYGRYWGGRADVEFLHFDACYYRPIEWAIAHGIRHFDPGAGGGHKLRRGFRVVPNFSLHRFADARLRQIMDRHIGAINRLEHHEIAALNSELPLRQVPS
jgi:uncharacterized protein